MFRPAGDARAGGGEICLGGAPDGGGGANLGGVWKKAPRENPPLPLEQPAGEKWEVRLVAINGRFALSLRRTGQTYANAVVEKHLGVPATTRNWNTVEAIREVLEK